jgi:PAS domain S-box-containing protein
VEVLFLSFSDPDLPDIAGLVEEAETQILENRALPVHFTLEYVNPAWLKTDPVRKRTTLSFLAEAYRSNQFDLVVIVDEEAPILEERPISVFFAKTPVLFAMVGPTDTAAHLVANPGQTGVIRKLNYLPTLQVALAQNPNTRQVIVISGSSDYEQLELSAAKNQFRSYEPNVEFQYWTNLHLADLQSRLSALNSDSVILFLNFLEDPDGQQFVPSRILPTLIENAKRPAYGTFPSFVGRGVVGGSVADLREVGRTLGRQGARILNGEKPENIPVQINEFQTYVFDWRQLHRWRIPTDILPQGSTVLFWESSSWELYRWRILGLSAVVILETLFVLLLLHAHFRRKRAEEALHRREAELLEAQRLAKLGSWQWDPRTDSLLCSESLFPLAGLEASSRPSCLNDLSKLFTPIAWDRLAQTLHESLDSDGPFELELELNNIGSAHWVSLRGEPVRDREGSVIQLRGTMQDITERKRAQEDWFKHTAVVESSDDAIIYRNLDGNVTSWNVGAQRIFEYSESEALARPTTLLIPAELQDEYKMIMRRVREGERVEHYETVRLSKSGRRISVSLTISPVRDLLGAVVGTCTLLRNITQQKQAEHDLRKSEEKFSKAFRHGPVAISLTSAKTNRYIDVNENFERMTGFSREELIGQSALELGIWMNPFERLGRANKLRADGNIRDVEFEYRTKDGRTGIALASAELIEIDNEPCVLGMTTDITDYKHALQALRESERRFRLMSDAAPVLMWMSGPDKLCNDFNQEWLRFTGRTLDQELGHGWAEGVHPDDSASCLDSYNRAFDSRQSFIIEYRLRRHDGEFRWMLDRGVPRIGEDGNFAGYIGCCFDITDQKQAKAALAEFGGQLIQAQEEERARIARELHDDINQRLALLANGLQELEMNSLPREDEGNTSIALLCSLTNEISADIQHLSHQLHPSKLHYLGLAAATRDLCHESSKLHKLQIDCMVKNVPRDLEENTSLSLFRVVQESLRNIAKHSHAHHVKVELVGEAGSIRLRVSDDGEGFDPDLHRNSGLGLVSMQERLRLVGGKLNIWSRPSFGTQVEAIVPASVVQARTA